MARQILPSDNKIRILWEIHKEWEFNHHRICLEIILETNLKQIIDLINLVNNKVQVFNLKEIFREINFLDNKIKDFSINNQILTSYNKINNKIQYFNKIMVINNNNRLEIVS